MKELGKQINLFFCFIFLFLPNLDYGSVLCLKI